MKNKIEAMIEGFPNQGVYLVMTLEASHMQAVFWFMHMSACRFATRQVKGQAHG